MGEQTDLIALWALLVFVFHMLLIAWVALRRRASLMEMLRCWERGLIEGRVLRGLGPQGALATYVSPRIGRSRGDGRIHFHDLPPRGRLFGGTIAQLNEETQLSIEACHSVEVWPHRAGYFASDQEGDCYEQAQRVRGWRVELCASILVGDSVWLWSSEGGALKISGLDPRSWARRAGRILLGLVGATVVGTVVCTALALQSSQSTRQLGALCAMLFFLLIMPIAKRVHDAVRTPFEHAPGARSWAWVELKDMVSPSPKIEV